MGRVDGGGVTYLRPWQVGGGGRGGRGGGGGAKGCSSY